MKVNKSVKASIIIRAYNEEAHIGKLIFGLQQQTEKNFEIIVVDSGSTDRTALIAEESGAKIISIKKSDFSFGRAINIGAEQAVGKYLVFVSAHVYPLTNCWLEKLLEPFESEKITVSYGKQRGGDTNKFSEHQLFETWFPDESSRQKSGFFCNNANCAIRKDHWHDRPYDEDLTGLEDLDWAKKSVEAGGEVAYVPSATIIHIHDETWKQVRNRYMREAMTMRRIEPEKLSFSFFEFVQLFLWNSMRDAIIAKQTNVLSKKWREIILFRYNQFWGTYQGYCKVDVDLDDLRRRLYYPQDRSYSKQPIVAERSNRIDYSTFDDAV